MRSIKTFFLLISAGFILSACSTDPISNNQPSDGYAQVYYKSGVQDSMAVGAILYDYLDLGVLDFTNSDTIKITFDYVAYNTSTHQFLAYYYDNDLNFVNLANFDISGSQNTYRHVEFTVPSPNSLTTFYYRITRTDAGSSYYVTRNFKISKK